MPFKATSLKSPPRVPVAFRVGIVGHRPNRLPQEQDALDALRHVLRSVLEAVQAEVVRFANSDDAKGLYADAAPVLRAVSPLAEGADRMFAEEAIALGYQMLCPLPFHREEFEQDFMPPTALEPDSLRQFRALLDRARAYGENALAMFELDGDRRALAEAYGSAGRVVLNQSDLLIAVWDGGKPAGGGGTAQTLREAVYYHVPVIRVHPANPHSWQLLSSAQDLQRLEGEVPQIADPAQTSPNIAEVIKTIVAEELRLSAPSVGSDRASATRGHAVEYFRQRRPRLNFAFVWKLFRDLVGEGRFRPSNLIVKDFESQIDRDWPIRSPPEISSPPSGGRTTDPDREHAPTRVENWVNRQLRAHYAWPDRRGDMYADAYRSAFVLVYLLSAIAVFLALLPMAAGLHGTGQIISVAAELAILLLIVVLLRIGSARHWHERWMEYRLLAELIRQVRILIPLGGGRPFPRVPAHLGIYGNLDQTWMYWHMRAIARVTGIPNERVTPQYLLDCLDHLGKIVGVAGGGQLQFHEETGRRSHHIWHRLHVAATALFILTILTIAIHLLLGLSDSAVPWLHSQFLERHHAGIDNWLVLSAATLPALGAALAGIANQGEFARLAKRSSAMADAFKQFGAQIDEIKAEAANNQDALTLSRVARLAEKIAEIMVEEVSDWRVIVVEPPVRA